MLLSRTLPVPHEEEYLARAVPRLLGGAGIFWLSRFEAKSIMFFGTCYIPRSEGEHRVAPNPWQRPIPSPPI
jgi:hypothetical protein